MGEEMHVSIEKGKTIIIRLMAIGPVVEGSAQRDVWFEVNGEVRAVSVEDKNSAVETVSREKSTTDPGSIGAPMSGVVIEVRVKEGQPVKKGDPLCGESTFTTCGFRTLTGDELHPVMSAMKASSARNPFSAWKLLIAPDRWNLWSPHQSPGASSVCSSPRVRLRSDMSSVC
jgi:hypothetical protein